MLVIASPHGDDEGMVELGTILAYALDMDSMIAPPAHA